jgi:hypothetical protein
VKTVGQEGDEDVSFDPLDRLMEDRAHFQIALEVLERRLDFSQLDVELPQLVRLVSIQIGAQQIATLAAAQFA